MPHRPLPLLLSCKDSSLCLQHSDTANIANPRGRGFYRAQDTKRAIIAAKAEAFHPGQGVYRSSYKNALRLAATETNIAYRTADYLRIQQLDFVVGIQVKLSNNHTLNGRPFFDICDELAGMYPKDFKFVGWHPSCRCYSVKVLKTMDEFLADERKLLNGEALTADSANTVRDMPPQFRQWVSDNRERIAKARAKGTESYFLRDNKAYVDEILDPKPNALQIAQKRHSARTEAQIRDIRKAWNDRRATRKYGQSILSYMGGIFDVDTTALQKALNGGNLDTIIEEARKLKAIGKEILSYSYLDNPMQVARQFSMLEAKAVNEAVQKKLGGWAGLSLEKQKSKLSFEIDWVQKHQKYATWEVAQNAYKKQLEKVSDALDWENIGNEFKSISSFKTKSQPYLDLVAKLQDAISSKDKAAAQQTILDIKKKREQLDKAAAQRLKVKGKANFDADAYSQKRKDAATWAKTREDADDAFRENTEKVWKSATHDEKVAATAYTESSGGVNRPLRGYDGSWHNFKGTGKIN